MDRQIVYPGAIPLDTDILSIQRNSMIGQGFLAQLAVGTSPQVWGLSCGATSPASLSVLVQPGAICSQQVVDTAAFGSLGTDSDALVKIGINTAAVTLSCNTVTLTAGQSVNYLIEAAFLEEDTTPVVLPYYNASNPAVPYTGPANSGASQNTQRLQRVQLTAKGGSPATTGSQATPTVDTGNIGLYVVTVAYGQATITSGNIATYAGAAVVGGGKLTTGRLINVQSFTSSGTYWATPGTASIIIEAVGGGGSGGGTAATGSGQGAVSSGGGAGSIAVYRFTSGFTGASGQSVTIGAGGAAPAAGNNNGNAGSPTGVGTLIYCPGGLGGQGGPADSNSRIVSSGGVGSGPSGTGSIIYSATGQPGTYGIMLNPGGSYYGGAGMGGISPLTAGSGGPGAGGSGSAAAGASSAATAGGAGNAGIVIIYEYA